MEPPAPRPRFIAVDRAHSHDRRGIDVMAPDRPTAFEFFVPVCCQVFDDYFARHGFVLADARYDRVRYDRVPYGRPGGDVFVSLSYYSAGSYTYWACVDFGLLGIGRWAPLCTRNSVPLSYVIPPGSPLRDYERAWKYSDPRGCRASLARVRDELLPAYAEPLWGDPARVRALVIRRDRELEDQFKRDIDDHNRGILRRRAEAAWRAKDYPGVKRWYEQVGEPNLSPVEKKKLEFATKRIGKVGRDTEDDGK